MSGQPHNDLPEPGAYAYDLAIVGSGGGAFSAAIAARRRDLRVVMIERGTAGGTCVNVGCIPSKALLAAAETRYQARQKRFPGITTYAGRIVAFQGLSVVEAPHRMRVDGRTLYAWCAWDTLFLPELIGKPTDVESNCPSMGATVSLRVGPDGPADLSPAEAVMSFVFPGTRFREDTIASFCNFEIGRHTNAAQWPEAIGRGGATESPA